MRCHALPSQPGQCKVSIMMQRRYSNLRRILTVSACRVLPILLALSLLAATPERALAGPPPAAVSAFNSYVGALELRLAQQHRSQSGFLASGTSDPKSLDPATEARLRRGEFIIERFTPQTDADYQGAMLHHWRGTAFAPGAKAEDFERLMKDFNAFPQHYSPQAIQARVLSQQGDRFQVKLRVRQRHVITVIMDISYDIAFTKLDPQHGYSIARSTQVSEIDSPGTSAERALDSKQEHGFLWRLNTYWTYEERDGGVYMQIESVTLTRSIPYGLAWAVGPFVESVPRESLEFTLRATCNALRR